MVDDLWQDSEWSEVSFQFHEIVFLMNNQFSQNRTINVITFSINTKYLKKMKKLQVDHSSRTNFICRFPVHF